MRIVIQCIAVVLVAAWTGDAYSQEGLVSPRATSQPYPEAPTTSFGAPLEGWIKVRYSVLADGTTANVRVIERVPPQLSDKAARAAVEQWQFAPATNGGAAIDWHNNESLMVFDVDEVPLEATPSFAQAYGEVEELMAAQEYDRAERQSERMLETAVARLREIGLAYTQAAILQTSLADLHSAYAAILLATDPRIPTLSAEELAVALRYRFVTEVRLGRVVESLATLARLNEIEAVPATDPMAVQAKAFEEALQGDAAIAVKARIDEDAWMHVPSRRTFAIADVDGTVEQIGIECDRRATMLPFQADSEWSLPESWGACVLSVGGKRGTTFSLYEFK